MKTIVWEVTVLSPPDATRHCKRCGGKTAHRSSGLFRVNAQQKALDIWLVYRCAFCKSTWNLPLFSRISPKSIHPDLLRRLMENDGELACRYAMDTGLLKRNGAEPGPPVYDVRGEGIDPAQDVRVRLACRHPAEVRVAGIIRKKLSLSKRAFDALVAGGAVALENGADIHRCRVQPGLVILFRRSPTEGA